MSVMFAYVTVPDKMEAERIGRILLEKRLAACVNIFGGMTSLYWWEGKLEKASEAVLIVKSISTQREAIEKEILSTHPYECPCLLFFEASGGLKIYQDWICNTVQPR